MRDESQAPLLSVRGLRKTFGHKSFLPIFKKTDVVHAVDDVDIDIWPGETLGLIGESGSGKSTLGRIILNLIRKNGGEIFFEQKEISNAAPSYWKELRKKIQIVFQDPYSSLNPRMTVRETIYDAYRAGGKGAGKDLAERASKLIRAVGLAPHHLDVYPHKLSGGQRQRIAIARALAVDPKFIVADEPVSALDVSIQAQILNLLADVQKDFGLTYLFVSHDLNVIRYLSDRVIVMYRGRIVEEGPAAAVFARPLHPYTQMLFASAPSFDGTKQRTIHRPTTGVSKFAGQAMPYDACQFAPRCRFAEDKCLQARPPLLEIANRQRVACIRAPIDETSEGADDRQAAPVVQ